MRYKWCHQPRFDPFSQDLIFLGGGSDSLSWISLIYSYAYMSSKRRVGRPRGKGKRKRAPAGPPLPEEVVQDPGSADRAAGLLLWGDVAPELGLALEGQQGYLSRER